MDRYSIAKKRAIKKEPPKEVRASKKKSMLCIRIAEEMFKIEDSSEIWVINEREKFILDQAADLMFLPEACLKDTLRRLHLYKKRYVRPEENIDFKKLITYPEESVIEQV